MELVDAILEGNLSSVKRLVSSEAKLDKDSLIIAAENGHYSIAGHLVSKGITDKETLQTGLVNAAWKGHLKVVKLLVAIGANPRAYSDGAFFYAAEAGHLDVVKYLASQGADILSCGDSLLVTVTEKGYLDIATFIIGVYDTLPQTAQEHPKIQELLNRTKRDRSLIAKHLETTSTVLSSLVARHY